MPPTDTNMPAAQVNYSERKEGAGPIIGAIIVVLLVVFGALYFWGQKLNQESASGTPVVQGQVSI